MHLDAHKQLQQNDEWRRVLQAYQAEQRNRKRDDDKHEGWVARLSRVGGVADSRLPRIHGKLIAHGLLTFHLAGRFEGVFYQVSPAGKQALAQLETAAANRHPPAETDEASDAA